MDPSKNGMTVSPRLLDWLGEGRREEAPLVAEAARKWGRQWLACGDAGLRGFQRERLTPYCHITMVHGPKMMEDVGGRILFLLSCIYLCVTQIIVAKNASCVLLHPKNG